jgi:retron-type reverse transcriptase
MPQGGFPGRACDFESSAYGYRPKRSAQDAVQEVHGALRQGYGDVVDADLSQYFDTIPHNELMAAVARRVVVAARLNRMLRGWANYFQYGTRYPASRAIDRYVEDRTRDFLRRRHTMTSQGIKRSSGKSASHVCSRPTEP